MNRLSSTLRKIHGRLGDFWWYSLMLFLACRAGDALNAFVGIWLVPRYVGPGELGAVMPLSTLANFLAIPVAVFATTFLKEVNSLATRGEYGRMKSLMRGVFVGAAIFLVLALAVSHFVLPPFLERIRIARGSLGFLIVAAGFIGAVSPVYQNALQALKKFRTISFLNVVGAPVRFVAMAAAMPFRALSGYFVGSAATPAFNIAASVFALRAELSVPAEPYWSRAVFRRFARFFTCVAAYMLAGGALGLVEQTVIRQRLPEVESAAYYMVSRFSEIAGFVGGTLTTIMFPFTAELAERGGATRPLVVKSSIAMAACGGALALLFLFAGRPVLAMLPDGDGYAEFAWAIPCLIMICVVSTIQNFHTTTEVSAGRFGFLKWWIPLNILFAAGLLLTTGYGYFTAYLPECWSRFLAEHNFTSLKAMVAWLAATAAARTAFSIRDLLRQGVSSRGGRAP